MDTKNTGHFGAQCLRQVLALRTPVRAAQLGERPAAVALILAGSSEVEARFLLIRRAEREGDPWSGHMALPGGRWEPGDADLFATACREAWEETGVRLEQAHCLGELDDVAPRLESRQRFAVRPFVFHLPHFPEVIPGPEVAFHAWTELEVLRRAPGQSKAQHGGRELLVPGRLLHGGWVWGLTHYVLENFRACWFDAQTKAD